MKPFVTYKYTSILNNGTLANFDHTSYIAIGTEAPSGSTVNSSLASASFSGTGASNSDYSIEKTFVAPANGKYIHNLLCK